MKVQSSVRMPSPRLKSFTRRITRKSRKKVIEMRELSSVFWNPLAQRAVVTTAGGENPPWATENATPQEELTALFPCLRRPSLPSFTTLISSLNPYGKSIYSPHLSFQFAVVVQERFKYYSPCFNKKNLPGLLLVV